MDGHLATSAPPEPAFPHIADRYSIEAVLGEGGMGEVYRAYDRINDQRVALKRLKPDAVEKRPALLALFEREYYALRELAHPSIIQVYDYGIAVDGGAYYTMEVLDGQDLRALAPLPWPQACALLRDVASSLAIVHSRRLLHRDVSPGNVHKDSTGRAKLLDFGTMATFGVEGQIVGTPPCIAPEMVNNQPLDARADLYSLGALGYFLLSGRHAYPVRRIDMLRDVWRSRPAALGGLVPDAPEELCSLLTSMISLDAMARPTSAGEVIERLTAIGGLEADESLDVARAYLKAPTLLGRNPALVRLRKQVLRAGRGRGSASLVDGPPGIGRTRMLDVLELEGKLAGATVLTASAADHTGRPYAVVKRLAQSLATQLPDAAREHIGPHHKAIARVLPGFSQLLSLPQPEEANQDHLEDADGVAMAAFTEWFDSLARDRTLIIAVDDLHEADDHSLSVISALAHRAGRRRLAVVATVTTSTEADRRAVAHLRRTAPQITLTPLDEDQTHQLVRSLFGDVPHVARVADWVSRLAEGKPRNCMELCEHLVERGIVSYRGGAWVLPPSLKEEELPKSFEDALAKRLSNLSQDAQAIAQGVALTTLPLALHEYPMLLSDGDRGKERAFAAVGELVASGILVGEDESYRLAQPAYVDTIRLSLEPSAFQNTHLRLVEVFRTRGHTLTIADHLLMAGDELGALQAVVDGYDETMGGPSGFTPLARARSFADDTALAIKTRRRLLEVCDERNRTERERFILRRSVILLSNAVDPSQGHAYIEPITEQLKHCLGLQHWDEPGPAADGPERIRHCMAMAKQHYDQADERDRVLAPGEAIPLSVMVVGMGQNIARQSYDVKLLRYLLDFADHLCHLSPRLVVARDSIAHSLALVTGRQGLAFELRQRIFKYYETSALPDSGNPLYFISQIGRAILLHTEGYFWAMRGGERAEPFAAILEDPLQGLPEEGNALRRNGHVWVRQALEVRLVMHLFNGDARAVRRTQDRIDQLALRGSTPPMGAARHSMRPTHTRCVAT